MLRASASLPKVLELSQLLSELIEAICLIRMRHRYPDRFAATTWAPADEPELVQWADETRALRDLLRGRCH